MGEDGIGPGPVPHGSISEAELTTYGLTIDQVIDFSVNTHPLGPSENVRAALAGLSIDRYPEERNTQAPPSACRSASETARLDRCRQRLYRPNMAVALASLSPGAKALVVGPTFGEYQRAIRAAGGQPVSYCADRSPLSSPDLADVMRIADEERPSLVFVCNPNNPTGHLLSSAELARIVEAAPTARLVVDEAYMSFVHSEIAASARHRGVSRGRPSGNSALAD